VNHEKRYQECGPLEKFWRRRHQLRVPYEAVRGWLWERRNLPADEHETFGVHWSIALGSADLRMNWVYTWEEAFGPRDGES
jgi:hypothetical protein